ncbi:hypothetical protein pqer_cds_39 [Pandoravirus quercus]|uniref:Uncharacterized protein n=1 Tax=Pandoravirus quercus TaxID=2107709 RepID=A0A2U7U7Q8_9VIRU|nr:hypothetical protein pqer_cds_39 [Pandoravirus quercus]AVK74461.1 hypothetical protein pqer_cds_39 [Pandoravirus quercus]
MHKDDPRDEGVPRQRDSIDDAVCRLYLLCQRARAGDVDAMTLLAPYLAPFFTRSLSGPGQGDVILPHPTRLARYYRHCWTAPIGAAYAATATTTATNAPPLTVLGNTHGTHDHGDMCAPARSVKAPNVSEANERACIVPVATTADDGSDADECRHADGLDDHGWTYHVLVGHGAVENDVVLFGLDRDGRICYETGYYVIPHGQDPDPIGGRSAGQRLGYAGRRRMPWAIGAHASALPSLLQAVAASTYAEAQATLCDQRPPEPVLSFLRSNISPAAEETHHTQPAGDASNDNDVDIHNHDRDGKYDDRRVDVMLGAATLRSILVPLLHVADLPPAIMVYISDNEPDADRLWLGGRPVSVASLGRRPMALSLRLYAGHMAGRRASWLFDRPSTLAGMAARVCATAAVPLDRRHAPAEALALVGAHIWHLVCADDPLPSGRLPRATRLLDAARALDVIPTAAELRMPELLCATLTAPALLCAGASGETCASWSAVAAAAEKDAF